MLEGLPQWMIEAWPWVLWIGGVGVVISVIFDVLRRIRRFRDPTKSAVDD